MDANVIAYYRIQSLLVRMQPAGHLSVLVFGNNVEKLNFVVFKRTFKFGVSKFGSFHSWYSFKNKVSNFSCLYTFTQNRKD